MLNDFRWYIVNVLSGSEKKVSQSINEQILKKDLKEYFDQVVVPVQEFIEIRKGQKVNSEKKFLPGYILIRMIMNEQSWHLVKNINKVSGFLGTGGKPQPISDIEAKNIFTQAEETKGTNQYEISFDIGESVKVIDGPFESFVGTVEEIDREKNRLKVSVLIFGRATPVELEYSQVDKI